jgi:signal peptidase I
VPSLLRHGGAAALTLLALAGLWWATAPPALGGKTTIVTVDGTSMLPQYKRADLVALRPVSHYKVGDVVGYRSSMLHRVVLHRIVGIKNGHYTFKGDNNSFTDPDQPTRADLVGKDAVHLPALGNVLQALRKPWLLALLAALAVLTLGVDIRRDPGNDPASL